MKLPTAALAAVCTYAFLAPPDSIAEFYRYEDGTGAIVIKNRLEDIPKEYRKKAKIVRDSDLESKDPLARRWNEAREKIEYSPQSSGERAPSGRTATMERDTEKGKTLVISVDEATGEIIRRFE